MASWSDIMKILPRVALQLLPGIMLGGGNIARTIEGAAAKKGLKGAAMTYPKLTQKFIYPIVPYYSKESWANNNGVQRDVAEKAAKAQSLEEHNRALMAGGPAAERMLESWWPGEDTQPRENFTPSSSAVRGVHILPNSKNGICYIQIQFRDGGKWYKYRGGSNPREASEAVHALLTAPSIGRALSSNGKKRHDYPGAEGITDSEVGWWGRNHYEPNW